MSMKIGFVCGNVYSILTDTGQAPRMGGSEIQQLLLGQEFIRHGHRVSFVTETPAERARSTRQGFELYGYQLADNLLHRILLYLRALWRADSDIYYSRGVSYYMALVGLVAWIKRRRYVVAVSSNRTVYPCAIAGFSAAQSLFYRFGLLLATRVVAQTRFQAELLARNYGVASSKLVVIPNGALAAQNTFTEHAATGRTVLWLATLHPYKNVEAVFALAERMPDYQFVIAGGPAHRQEAYYATVAQQAQAFANIEWRGFVAHDAVDELFQNALAFINTTQSTPELPALEGFPNVYLEAWRNGVPTLTCHNDPDGIIAAHQLGFVSGSISALEADLRRLGEDANLRQTLGENARRYFAQQHEIARPAQQYLDLFRILVSGA